MIIDALDRSSIRNVNNKHGSTTLSEVWMIVAAYYYGRGTGEI